MNREEAIAIIRKEYLCVDRDCDIDRSCGKCDLMMPSKEPILEAYKMAIKALEQEPCEMTAEEYRKRMIQAFHNADTDELIAICVLPTEKEFEHLEWLLKNHYKKESCDDAIDRAEAIKIASGYCHPANVAKELAKLPPVNPTKTGHWILDADREHGRCSECGCKEDLVDGHSSYKWCSNCGARMVEPQERSDKG